MKENTKLYVINCINIYSRYIAYGNYIQQSNTETSNFFFINFAIKFSENIPRFAVLTDCTLKCLTTKVSP